MCNNSPEGTSEELKYLELFSKIVGRIENLSTVEALKEKYHMDFNACRPKTSDQREYLAEFSSQLTQLGEIMKLQAELDKMEIGNNELVNLRKKKIKGEVEICERMEPPRPKRAELCERVLKNLLSQSHVS